MSERQDWLAWRREGIGASETAALFGQDPFKTKLDVWCSKVLAPEPDYSPSEAAEVGLLMEPAIQTLYERRTGRKVVATQVRARCVENPRIQATLDGIDDAGELVEFKSIGFPHSDFLGEPGTDEVPPWWLLQGQSQMLAHGKARAVNFAVLAHGREFRQYRMEWNVELQDAIYDEVSTFWLKHVETKTAPDPDLPADAKHLARIFSQCEGDVEVTDDLVALVARWDDALSTYQTENRQVQALKEHADEIKNQILLMFGNAKLARLPDGRTLERAIRTRKAHEVKESSWVELKLKTPKGVAV